MAIGKMLKLGGLENSSPKTGQTPGKFKVANNVTFTNQQEITPRPSMSGFQNNAGPFGGYTCTRWELFSFYGDAYSPREVLKWGTVATGLNYKYLWKGDTVVPFLNGVTTATLPYDNNFSCQSSEINNVKYILDAPNTSKSAIYKYAGYEVYPTGIGLPWASTSFKGTSFDSVVLKNTDTTGTSVKIIQNNMDMKGNVVSGNSLTFNVNKSNNDTGIGKVVQGVDNVGNTILVGSNYTYSYDGINWDCNTWRKSQTRGLFSSGIAYGLVSGVPTFVQMYYGTNGTSALNIDISNDGKFWQTYTSATLNTATWSGSDINIAYGNGVFVAINNSGSTTQSIATSTDGITWNHVNSPISNNLNCIAYGGSGANIGFVILAANGTSALTSTNGTSWTVRTVPSAQVWTSLVWGPSSGRWAAVASTGTTTTQLMTSSNPFQATGWTLRTSPAANQWNSITVGLDSNFTERFYAIAFNNTATAKLMTSTAPDTTWTAVNVPTAFNGGTVGFIVTSSSLGTGVFCASGFTLPLKTIYSSLTTWTETDNVNLLRVCTNTSSANIDSFFKYIETSSYYEPEFNFDPYFIGIATYNSLTTQFEAPVTTSEFNLDPGVWVIRPINFFKTVSGRLRKISAIAYEVASDSPPNIIFNATVKLYDSNTLEWIDFDVSANPLPEASGRFIATRTFYTVWASPSRNGIHYYKGIVPASPKFKSLATSNYSYDGWVNIAYPSLENKVQKASSLPFSMAGSLNDWYATTSFKISFNEIFSQDPAIAMTTYMGQLLVASSQIIYFSDPTSGGSIEMTEGLASIVVGNSEDGKITAILGNEDYLIVSRERKVYLVTGNLSTAQYRIQEIFNIPVGAYSNSCLLAVQGGALLLSSVGVFFIDGPNATNVSASIPLNFRTFFRSYTRFHPAAEQDALVFNMNNYPVTAWTEPNTKKYITSCFDANRGLAIFTTSETGKAGNSLVFHTANKEFTTWNSYDLDGYETSAMTAFDGKLFVGTINPAGNSGAGIARTAIEVTDPTVYTYDYISRSAPKLVSTWMTVEEPSLEKLLLQLKMYGYIRTNLQVRHYANWDLTTPITTATYTTPGNYVFFHKQRFNSSKQMAVAIEIQLLPSGETFWIEGIEVEFDLIQAGMKR